MTKQEANQLLEDTFAKAFDKAFEENPDGAAKVIKNYNKLNITEYREYGKTTGNLRAVAMERLHALPVVMAEQIAKLEKQMRDAAKMLEFELAAALRDQIIELRGK